MCNCLCVYGATKAIALLDDRRLPQTTQTPQAYEALAASKTDADIVGRVFLYSTLPLCLLLAALIIGKLLAFVWQDLVGIARFMRRALSPYTQRCCARLDEEELADGDAAADDDDAVAGAEEGEGGWRGQERERDPKTAKAWRRQMRTRVNNYPPYTRKFEVMYADRSRVPDFPPDWCVACVCACVAGKRRRPCLALPCIDGWMVSVLGRQINPLFNDQTHQ